jgi:hypothetical protein
VFKIAEKEAKAAWHSLNKLKPTTSVFVSVFWSDAKRYGLLKGKSKSEIIKRNEGTGAKQG